MSGEILNAGMVAFAEKLIERQSEAERRFWLVASRTDTGVSDSETGES